MKIRGKYYKHNLLPDMEKQKPNQPANWTPRHRMVVLMYSNGFTRPQIAHELGMNSAYVGTILSDDRGKAELARIGPALHEHQIESSSRIKALAPLAIDRLEEVLRTSEDEKTVTSTAFGVLDRGGYSPIKKSIVATTKIDPEVLAAISSIKDDDLSGVDVDFDFVRVDVDNQMLDMENDDESAGEPQGF